MALRPYLLASALSCSVIAACGGDDEGNIIPEGEHYHFVANKVLVPTTNNQAREYGLDIGSSDGSGPDGTVDNQLGMVLSTLGSMGFDIQATIDEAVAEGSIVLLVDFQTKDFQNTTAAGIQVFLGDKPTMPAPCNTDESYDPATKTGCGRHLDGNGMFSIAAGSPTNAALGGRIVNGTFNGGPGDLSLQIALGGSMAINLNLIGARARATSVSENGIGTLSGNTLSGGVVFAGAVTKDDIDNNIIPAIQQQLVPTIEDDCTDLNNPPNCGCADGSTGKTILGLFDTTPKDCMVTVDEIKNNSLIVSLLAPDVKINGKDALSLGIKAGATKGTFSVPGQ
jgi:hypothetical protein